ncbi:uncharacterized protein LOC121411755 [Lytechinus variegatus]|uniref:uncharacterized protein LOC121411755 n=1 Tax=Lytechinus variegatus TaxID=7654 RepID=UPI001BB2CF40|nr:uncharacterized protein LOC121411755 [Lytechinus variegatus]
MMKVLSSTDRTMKLVLAICYNLLLLITEIRADDSSKSSESNEESDDTAKVRIWPSYYGYGYPGNAGGTAQEEVDEQPENESPQTPSTSFNEESASTPFTRTDQSSSVSFGTVSVTTVGSTTLYRKSSESSDNDGELDKSTSDGEENETDNEENGEGGGRTSPTVTMATITSDSGKRDFFPLQPLSGRTCFVIGNQNEPFCKCTSPPPRLPKFLECSRRISRPGEMKSSRRHGDCDILCVCWILAFVGVVIGAVCKVSINRRTHF